MRSLGNSPGAGRIQPPTVWIRPSQPWSRWTAVPIPGTAAAARQLHTGQGVGHLCGGEETLARRNSRAEPTYSATKTAFRPNTWSTPGAKSCSPLARAMRGTTAWARAVANNARAIPRGSRRATTVPMTNTAGTPKYSKLTGPSPMMPTAPVTQRRRRVAASATPTAARCSAVPTLLVTSSYARPVPNMSVPMTAKSSGSQFHSSDECVATRGMSGTHTVKSTARRMLLVCTDVPWLDGDFEGMASGRCDDEDTPLLWCSGLPP